MKLLLFFVDGLGLGADVPENPARRLLDGIAEIPFTVDSAPADFPEGILRAADATGGVSGLPQSATGQASLMTGVNAPALLGYHLTALPNEPLTDLIAEEGMMAALRSAGVSVTASNLYTPEFFRRREELEVRRKRNAFPVSALTIRGSGVPFRMPEDYLRGRAVYTDLTNRFIQGRGYDIPIIEPEEAARRMAGILGEADFVFHEYFATDTYAHKKMYEDLDRALSEINRFLRALLADTDREETAILLVSDHGNCEERSSADHSRNPVPVLLLSRNERGRSCFDGVRRLEEVKGAVLAYFGLEPPCFSVPEDSWV